MIGQLSAVVTPSFGGSGEIPQKIILPSNDGFTILDLEEIIRCEGAINYSKFYLTNGEEIRVSKSLGQYEKLLKNANFVRVHKSHLINLNHVRKFTRGNTRSVIMSDSSKVEISRRKKDDFINSISQLPMV